jgi:hypothetical protein
MKFSLSIPSDIPSIPVASTTLRTGKSVTIFYSVLLLIFFLLSIHVFLDARALICKRLRSPGIDTKEPIPTVYVAWQAGTTTLFEVPARQAT